MEAELPVLTEVGIKAAAIADLPLPFSTRAALRIERQTQFTPAASLLCLVRNAGSYIFETIHLLDIDDGDPCHLLLEGGGSITAGHVAAATHILLSLKLLPTELIPLACRILRLRLHSIPPAGLFRHIMELYHHARSYSMGERDLWIVGETEHVRKRKGAVAPYHEIEEYAGTRYDVASVECP